jgi:intracellular sulfur oxidation DsrE/DsrF family protein
MKRSYHAIALTLPLLAALVSQFAIAAMPEAAPEIRIDVPVELKRAKVVFNMDHLAFSGDAPIGIKTMAVMAEKFKKTGIEWSVAGVFQGVAGYMLLNDEAYNQARRVKTGNPYKVEIAQLIKDGVIIEECGVTMKGNHWTNANLLPGVKVNTGANFRLVDLMQQGYIMLQP